MKVIKRDGTLAEFNKEKIYNAIAKANESCIKDGHEGTNNKTISKIVDYVCKSMANADAIYVEDIQEIVESGLMKYDLYDVAKEYIRYRYLHKVARNSYKDFMDAISEKITAKNVQNQNANVDERSFGGRAGETTDLVLKRFALENIMSKKASAHHANNEIYTHDLSAYALGDHNCFHPSTKFLTKSGVKKFSDCIDGQTVKVLASDGKWRKATVHDYGRKKMYELTFRSSQTFKTVICTRNHRWVLDDGTVTDDIQIGDSLMNAPEVNVKYDEDPNLWCFGFVLGDGCDHALRSKDRSHVTNYEMQCRLCGDKIKYANKFEECGWSKIKIKGSSDYEMHSRANGAFKQNFLDSKMWKIMSHDDICNIFDGYIHADGHFDSNGSLSISTSDERIKEFIEYSSALLGYHVWSQSVKTGATNFKDDRTLYNFYLVKTQRFHWTLVSIKNMHTSDGMAHAWCVEEPKTHSFTLFGGMLTGNCLSVPFDDLLANGFKTRSVDIRPAGSVSTALQLVAVIFQLQSLCQFGGVSATHIDYTLVPYVRKSFLKHYIREYMKEQDDFYNYNFLYMDADELDDYISNNKNKYLEMMNLTEKDFRFDNIKNLDKNLAQRALFETRIETYQGAEALFHNLNSLQSRSGNQLPFTSINYGTCTSEEGRLVTNAILDSSIKGVGRLHKTPVFPCGIFKCLIGTNRKAGDPNYDLYRKALRSTAKRLYPNYANCNWSGNAGWDPNDPRTEFSTINKTVA